MTDLNDLWEKSRPVTPNAPAPTGPRVPAQTQQQPNSSNQSSGDALWDSARPVNPNIGTTEAPATTPAAPHEPTWGEAAEAMIPFGERWRKSAVKTGQEIVEGVSAAGHKVITDPIGTAKQVGSALLDRAGNAIEAMSSPTKAVASIAGPWLEPDTKKALSRGVAGYVRDQFGIGSGDDGVVKDDPMMKIVHDRYGTPDRIKKTMYEDPFGVTLDLATAAAGGEALAMRTGLTGTARVLGGISRLDPITLAMKGLPEIPYAIPGAIANKGIESFTANTLPKTLGWRSGVGPETTAAIKDLHDRSSATGQFYGNAGREEFHDAFTGNVTARQVVDRAEQGIDNMRQQANLGYGLDKDRWVRAGGRLDMSIINQVERDTLQSLHTPGGIDLLNQEQRNAVSRMQEVINEVRQRGPGGWTVEELDAMKRRISKIAVPLGDRETLRVRTALSNAVKDNILANAQSTPYHASMQRYQAAMTDLDAMRDALSLGKDAPEHTVMTKLQSILRNNANTQYGARNELVDILEQEGGVHLRPWLLGMATNADAPRGVAGAVASGVSGGTGATLGAIFGGGLPGAIVGGTASTIAELASRSPRNAARIARGMGAHGADWSEAFPLMRYPALVGDREKNKRGGRVGYAEGGEVESLTGTDPLLEIPMPALRGAVNAALPKAIDPMTALLGKSRIGPSQLLLPPRGEHDPQVKAPAAPAAESGGTDTDKMVKQLGAIYGEVSGEAQERRDKEKAEKEAALRGPAAVVPAAAGDVKAAYQGAGGSGAVTYDQTLGLPEAKPIPGDSYEAKVGSFESSGSDTAVNKTTGAAGVFQFMPSTAEGIRRARPDLGITDNWRTNREDQMKLMKAYTDDSRAVLAKMGQEATGGRLYMMHLFGQGGGQRVLSQLDKPIKEITTDAERAANPFLNQFLTGKDLLNYFERRFG